MDINLSKAQYSEMYKEAAKGFSDRICILGGVACDFVGSA